MAQLMRADVAFFCSHLLANTTLVLGVVHPHHHYEAMHLFLVCMPPGPLWKNSLLPLAARVQMSCDCHRRMQPIVYGALGRNSLWWTLKIDGQHPGLSLRCILRPSGLPICTPTQHHLCISKPHESCKARSVYLLLVAIHHPPFALLSPFRPLRIAIPSSRSTSSHSLILITHRFPGPSPIIESAHPGLPSLQSTTARTSLGSPTPIASHPHPHSGTNVISTPQHPSAVQKQQ